MQVTPSQLFAVAGRVGTGLNINTCSLHQRREETLSRRLTTAAATKMTLYHKMSNSIIHGLEAVFYRCVLVSSSFL